jgi:tetratricopeptide (TPR) repeat protein
LPSQSVAFDGPVRVAVFLSGAPAAAQGLSGQDQAKTPPHAQRQLNAQQADEYRKCMALARKRPKDAFEMAIGWRSLDGGDAADHCAAVALIELEQFAEAAKRLERLAQISIEEPKVKAGLYDQAGQAWLLEGRPEDATRAFTMAVGLKPGDPDLLVDRAQSWAARHDYEAAEADLSAALNLAPSRDDIYALRASARRFMDRREDALADANTALELNAGNPEALLERGILRRLGGDHAGARSDWLRILNGMPDSAAAGSARQNIENMDVDRGEPPPTR